MKTTYKYFKSSNTGQMVRSQTFTETALKGIPVYFYDIKGEKIGEDLTLNGFVEISERKFLRYKKAILKELK